MVDRQQMLSIHGDDNCIPDLGDQDLGFVLDLHVCGSENLGVDTLGQTREDVPPWRPDRHTEIEGSADREDGIEDDVEQISIQEEEDKISEIHQDQQNHWLLLAENITDQFVTQTLSDFHGGQNIDRILDRERQEKIGFSQLGTENHDPETIGHPHVVAQKTWVAGSERLAGDIAARVLGQVASE